jgi:hypothetical protein
MDKFDELIQAVNKNRPFRMYLHGCKPETANLFVNGADLNVYYNRDSLASTAVNGGTVNTDYQNRFKSYTFTESASANVVMIMPDAICIDQYCGAIEGQVGVTRGYGNHNEQDYTFMATSSVLSGKKYTGHLNQINNGLILGYYDKETNEFVLNENCLLLNENQEEYDRIISQSKDLANESYDYRIKLHLIQQVRTDENAKEIIGRIANDPTLMEDIKIGAQLEYMLSPECEHDRNFENTNFLIEYYKGWESNIDKTAEVYFNPTPVDDSALDNLQDLLG